MGEKMTRAWCYYWPTSMLMNGYFH